MSKENDIERQKLVEKIEKIDKIQEVNKEIKEQLKRVGTTGNKRKVQSIQVELEPERELHSLSSQNATKIAHWRFLNEALRNNEREDVEYAMVKRIYDVGMGRDTASKESLMALTYLLDRFVSKDTEVIPAGIIHDDDIQWDTPQAINDMAARILYLMLHRHITISNAERLCELLKLKISFIETSVIMKDVEELKRVLGAHGHKIQELAAPK